MEESVDVRALRARFTNQAGTSDAGSRDSGSPKSPRPGLGRAVLPPTDNDQGHHRLSPVAPPPLAGPGLVRFPRPDPLTASGPRPPSFPRPPPYSALRGSVQQVDASKVRQTGELLQNMMLRHQRPAGPKPGPAPGPAPPPPPPPPPAPAPAPAPTLAHVPTPGPLRQNRQRSAGEVVPLKRPLPAEGPPLLKPKRPPSVNLEPFRRFAQGPPALPGPRRTNGAPASAGRQMSLPAVISPPRPPHHPPRPSRLPHQVASVDLDDDQEQYDDIASFEQNESWSENSSQCVDGDDEDVYEFIDEDQMEVNPVNVEPDRKEAKRQQEQERRDQMQRQKRENELRKNFKLHGAEEVIHTAKVRHDWFGGAKLDLGVRQGDSVEIIRVKDNPEGKWLARSMSGKYGYISNTCVDIDYEAVKRKALQSRRTDPSALPLPPPPPDPPQLSYLESNSRDSLVPDDDDYDDVQPLEEFPPPPAETSIDPKVEKELRKKFKLDGPLKVLHTVMVDPNSLIKKPGGKDLPVVQGEILDVIRITNSKKALCRNRFGKYGYVNRSLLLSMEGDIYDDVDYAADVYDNDSPHTDY